MKDEAYNHPGNLPNAKVLQPERFGYQAQIEQPFGIQKFQSTQDSTLAFVGLETKKKSTCGQKTHLEKLMPSFIKPLR
jgi:hypothetical protein